MVATLDDLRSSTTGLVRTARKTHACIGANEVRYWKVRRTCEHGWSESTIRIEAEIQPVIDYRSKRPCHGDKMPQQEEWTVTPHPNPEYRPDCLRVINPGDRYYEYMGDVPWQSGTRYCERCAVAVWTPA